MFGVIIFSIWFSCYCARADVMETNHYKRRPSRVLVGEVLGEISNISKLRCGAECSSTSNCCSVNYEPTNRTCTLLHVEEPQDDWLDAQNSFIWDKAEIDFTASVGFWSFNSDTSNYWNASAIATTHNTPFVPAVPGGSTNVISFLGHKDSYVVLESNGDPNVTSFTWAAKVYPEIVASGVLFHFFQSASVCNYAGLHGAWIHSSHLHVGICRESGDWSSSYYGSLVLAQNSWNDVAVSYNAGTGNTQIHINGRTHGFSVAQSGAGYASGPLVIGSRYYHSGSQSPTDTFKGSMACVRLWSVARDLDSLRIDSPLCNIT